MVLFLWVVCCGELLVRTGRVVLGARLVAVLLGGLGDLTVAVDDGGALAEGDRLARLALFLYFRVPSATALSLLSCRYAPGVTDNISHDCGVCLVQRVRLVV